MTETENNVKRMESFLVSQKLSRIETAISFVPHVNV